MTAACAFGLSWPSVDAGAVQAPPVPTSLNAKPLRESIRLSWHVSTRKGLQGFRLLWRPVSAPKSAQSRPVDLSSTARSYRITGLAPGTYEVLVRAVSRRGIAGGAARAKARALRDDKKPPREKEPPHEKGEKGEKEEVGKEGEKEKAKEKETGGEGAERSVPAAPSGPVTPSGGWSVVYGDAFARPPGTGAGHDDTLYPNVCESTSCAGFNRDELETFKSPQETVGSQGLELTCQYTGTTPKPYNCGGVYSGAKPPSYHGFTWTAGSGQTFVFQAVSKFPPNTGDADVSWWSDGPPWQGAEFDFYEAENLQHEGWCTGSGLFTAWFAPPHIEKALYNFGCSYDPTAAYHTYTTEIFPDNTFSAWIDGTQWANHVGPAKAVTDAVDYLTLSYGVREEGIDGFKSGARTYYVKSIEVWEDTSHKGVGLHNEGLAPGTTVGDEPAVQSSAFSPEAATGETATSGQAPEDGQAAAPAPDASIEPQLQESSSEPPASAEKPKRQSAHSTAKASTPSNEATETTSSAPATTAAAASATSAGK